MISVNRVSTFSPAAWYSAFVFSLIGLEWASFRWVVNVYDVRMWTTLTGSADGQVAVDQVKLETAGEVTLEDTVRLLVLMFEESAFTVTEIV